MKNKPIAPASDDATSPAAFFVGSLKFTALQPGRQVSAAAARFTQGPSGRGQLRFNRALIEQHPELGTTERLSFFLAEGSSPVIALLADEQGVKTSVEKHGGMKVTTSALAPLAKKYQRIDYRVEAMPQPRKGWLLHPLKSELSGP